MKRSKPTLSGKIHGKSVFRGGVLIGTLMAAGWALGQTGADIPLGPSCVTSECHQDVKVGQYLHGPVNLDVCEPCHVPVNNQHVFDPASRGPESCLTCHEAPEEMPVVHEPFATDCVVCHDPHGSDVRYFVNGGLGVEGCRQCHAGFAEGMDFLHGPVALGECLACHSPHQSEHEGLLIDSRPVLCMGCHIDVEESLQGAVSVHEAVSEQCAGCHDPHGGSNQYFQPAEGIELCRTCHGEFLETIQNVKYTHTPIVEGESCENCHEPHASNQEYLLEGNVEDICLTCHGEPIETEGKTIYNVAAQLEESKFLHGPLQQGNCSACHAAHGSDFPQILDKEFPRQFYAPYEDGAYDLCFDCHDKTLVLEEKSTATGFRNGTENLHYLHVHREKGRTCRACHHEHATNQPNHIRSEVPFGRWMMKVEFNKTDTGGGCTTGCHLPYEYDRENPVERESASEEQSSGETPET